MRYQVQRIHEGRTYYWRVIDTVRNGRVVMGTSSRLSAEAHASWKNWRWRRELGALRRKVAPILKRHRVAKRSRIVEEIITVVCRYSILVLLAGCVQVLDIRDPTVRPEVNACCLTGQGDPDAILECVDRYVNMHPTPEGGLECLRVSCGFVEVESTSCEAP